MVPGVEDDQVSCMGPDDCAIPFHRRDARCGRVVREDELTAFGVIRAEQHSGERVGIDVTLEAHRRPELNVEDNAIAVVLSRSDRLRARLTHQIQKVSAIGPVEPG
jgi:hypothetical protein